MIGKLILISLTALLACCGQENKAPSTPTGKAKPAETLPGTAAPAPPGAPPPPSKAATPAAPAGASDLAAPAAPRAVPGTDPLFYFRRDEKGRYLGDLEALQLAAEAYAGKAAMGEEAGQPVWPNLTNLSQLVKVGMLKALPAAPAGQKYVVDPKTHRVSLANVK